MERVRFDDAERYEPEPGWQRVAFAGSDSVSLEYFEKPVEHSSPMHAHENDQVCVCLEGELTIVTDEDEVTLTKHDSVYLPGGEQHRVTNQGDDLAIGIDVFVPGRPFDFWDTHG